MKEDRIQRRAYIAANPMFYCNKCGQFTATGVARHAGCNYLAVNCYRNEIALLDALDEAEARIAALEVERTALGVAEMRESEGSGVDAVGNLMLKVQKETAIRCAEIADSHVDHGEFWHGGRHDCEYAIAKEIRTEFACHGTGRVATEARADGGRE